MQTTARTLKVFLASPGDVKPERAAAEELVNDINKQLRSLGWQIVLYMWEDVVPGFGAHSHGERKPANQRYGWTKPGKPGTGKPGTDGTGPNFQTAKLVNVPSVPEFPIRESQARTPSCRKGYRGWQLGASTTRTGCPF